MTNTPNVPPRARHATAMRDGFEVPLIGIPPRATEETCERCGAVIGLVKAVFDGHQVLCRDCARDIK